MSKSAFDLSGMRFGKLTVIKRAENAAMPCGRTRPMWECLCDCGNKKVIDARSLKHGISKSCGCSSRGSNHYYDNGDGTTTVSMQNGNFIIDTEDVSTISGYYWKTDRTGYVKSLSGDKWIILHRLILNCPDDMIVDHINRNKKDNRKSNLRICTISENNLNHGIAKNNKSGFTGVMWKKRYEKWEAYITYKGKTHYLGRYNNIDDAVNARKKAERKYYGEFACKDAP